MSESEAASTRPLDTYSKYCANVYLAKCRERHERGDIIKLETQHGDIHEVQIWNFIYEQGHFTYYSVTRTDGYNMQERAKAKAERHAAWAAAAEKRSDEAWDRSQAAVEGLDGGQPILVGHHSEKKHRRAIQKSFDAMDKMVEENKKASLHNYKSAHWKKREREINLSLPESIEYYEFKFEEAEALHKLLKEKPELREHSYSLTYAKNNVNNYRNLVITAKKLWGDNE